MFAKTLGSELLLKAQFGGCGGVQFLSCVLSMESEGGGKENSHGIGYQRTDVLLRSACTQNRVMLDSTSCRGDGRVSRSVPLSVTGILS